MSKNKTLITAFSLSSKSNNILEKLQKRTGKTRSEIVRNLINSYAKSVDSPASSASPPPQILAVTNSEETNKILKYYYQIISAADRKPTMVIGIAIISRRSKVLIGLRKSTDKHVKNLSWTFPSGKFNSLNFESELTKTIKQETGLVTKNQRLIHARLIPDSPGKKVRIVALYYHCKTQVGKPESGGDFKRIMWVPATDVTKFFTTSTSDEIMNFLGSL